MESLFVSEITVLGIGNTILSDEGFGVRVVEFLRDNYIFPENVQLVDGGTLGVELLGAQPFSLDAGLKLTPQMQKLLPIFAEKSLEILTAWKVNWRKNL